MDYVDYVYMSNVKGDPYIPIWGPMKRDEFNNLLLQTKLLLPPMCGYTDYPYRKVLAQFGGKILCTEMIKAKALLMGTEQTLQMLMRSEDGAYTGVQLFGSDPQIMAEAARKCQDMGFSFVDINLGCPARKVMKKKEGGALLKDLPQIKKILQAVRKAISIPLTIKTRLGFKRDEFTALPLAQMAKEIGVDAMTIHARSIEQKYLGTPEWEKISEISATVKMPIIANGGICNGAIAKQVLHQTGAVAVMPGRSILGNPWLIEEILYHLQGTPKGRPRTIQTIKEIATEHFSIMAQFYDERTACLNMRRFLSFYFKGFRGVATFRKKLPSMNTQSDFLFLLEQIEENHCREAK